ncbi:MAG: hypothetical protein PVJ49_14345 [Acidobacteriota bacterium]
MSGAIVGGCGGTGAAGDAEKDAASPTIALEPVATIGCADCAGPELITPTVISLLEDGRLAVLDRYEPFVRIFGPGGQPELSFGSRGQGPGELGSEMGGMYFSGAYLLPWPDGELSVLELMPAVLETFSASGEFLRQETLDLPFAAPGAQAFAPSTGTYFRHSYLPTSEEPDVIERCIIDVNGGSECAQITTAIALTGAAPEGFRAVLAAAATPSGELVIADTATYRLWVLDGDGNAVRQFGRDIPPPPKSAEQLEAEREANRARLESGREEREIDPSRPYIVRSGIQVDGSDRIWVLTQRYTADEWVFDVLDAEGAFLNEVRTEALTAMDGYQITPFAITGDRLAVVSNQADGSARIDVYRIVESD